MLWNGVKLQERKLNGVYEEQRINKHEILSN